MRKVTIDQLLLFVNQIIGILWFLIDGVSAFACTIYAVVTIVLLTWCMLRSDDHRITYSSAILIYTIAIQFGLIIPYILFGRDALSNYTNYTLRFMNDAHLTKAIILGIIAVSSYEIGVLFSRKKYRNLLLSEKTFDVDMKKSQRIYAGGTICLLIVLIFFAYNILSGGMRLFATYSQFRESSAYNSSIYSYILILFYVGTIYLASAGRIKEHIAGWTVWSLLVIIFAMNGNKGEFLYALLAVLGMKGIEGKKISGKMLVLIAILVFVIIPSITSLRSVGLFGNVRQFEFKPFDAFTEMGMQIRTSVYLLGDYENGVVHRLWGRSYYQPILNIVTPFLKHTQATAEIRRIYPGYGFNQVIESYLNFGIVGVVGYFGIVGYFLGKFEAITSDRYRLAYLGTITCILINATRNYFAFVPGQILIVTGIYIILTKTILKNR